MAPTTVSSNKSNILNSLDAETAPRFLSGAGELISVQRTAQRIHANAIVFRRLPDKCREGIAFNGPMHLWPRWRGNHAPDHSKRAIRLHIGLKVKKFQ